MRKQAIMDKPVYPIIGHVESTRIREWPVLGSFIATISIALTLFLYLNHFGLISFMALGIGGTSAILLWPQGGLYLLAFSLPFSGLSFQIPGVASTPKIISIVIMMGLLLRLRQISLREIFSPKSIRVFTIMALYCGLLLPFSAHLEGGMEVWFIQLRILLLVLIVHVLLRDLKRFRTFTLSFTTGALVFVSLVLAKGPNWVEAMQEKSTRLSTGMNPNQLAEILGIAFGSAIIYLAIQNEKSIFIKLAGYLGSELCVVGIILTQSRAGIIGITMFVIVLTLYSAKHSKLGAKAKGLLMITIICAGAYAFLRKDTSWNANEDVSARIDRTINGITGRTDPGTRADVIWPNKLAVFMENPLIGAGPGLDRAGKSSHNDMLYQLSNFGLIGFVLFIILIISLWKEAISPQNEYVRSALTGMLLYLIIMGIAHTTILHVSFGIAIALISRYRSLELREVSSQQIMEIANSK